ncbi:YozE family protein, partial [Schleiferilactobacillus shenzhenensis]|uniref:YozE family protein n=1 Tax=Schleiferilactobacillus shenzhenensis TaxID=1231337 RepID=UPI0009DF9D1B
MLNEKPVHESFSTWLKRCEGLHSPVGDLAEDAKHDSSFPRRATKHAVLLHYLNSQHASEPALEAFERA